MQTEIAEIALFTVNVWALGMQTWLSHTFRPCSTIKPLINDTPVVIPSIYMQIYIFTYCAGDNSSL